MTEASAIEKPPVPGDRASPADAVLRVADLRTYLRSRDGTRIIKAVDGISFAVSAGRTLGIVGESGSGKSVAALSVMRLLPKGARIVSGSIDLGGTDLLARSDREMQAIRGNRIAMILQDPMVALDPLYRIGNQMAEPLRYHGVAVGPAALERMVALLEAVGIPDPEQRLNQYPHQMSGGMLQRIVCAIALSCDPEVLIADEPTTALDVTVQAQLLDMLIDLKESRGLALIIITHDFGVAARVCDDIMVMYAGRVVERAPVREIFNRPSHPYTRALLSAIPKNRSSRGERLVSIVGHPPDPANLPPGCPFAPRCPEANDQCRRIDAPEVMVAEGHMSRCWLAGAA